MARLHVSVPRKVRIDDMSRIVEYNEIQDLFNRNGFSIAHFSSRGVSFYDSSELVERHVPIDNFFFMSKKEFVMFVSVLKQLDLATKGKTQ